MSLLSRRHAAADVDLAAVHAALARVEDPELHLPLDEAGMVGGVEVGRSGAVSVTIRLTTPSCPLKETLARDVSEAVGSVAGVERVEVSFSAMTENERMQLASRLRGSNPEGGHRFGLESATQVYAVASGKGGVGKSTVTANLAVALAQQGRRVGILDADVWGYSVPQLFGVRRAPVALKGLMLPVEAHGVALMSVGFLVSDEEPVVWRGPMLHKALEQFLSDVHWGELDTLLIDLPPGTGDITMSLLELVPDAALIAVTTPQVAAQTVAERVGADGAQLPDAGRGRGGEHVRARLRLVRREHRSVRVRRRKRLAEAIAAPLLGAVPLDIELRLAGDAGVPAMVRTPGARSVAELRRIAAELPVVQRSLVGRSLPLSVV